MNITLSDRTKMIVEYIPFSSGVDGDLFWWDDKKRIVKFFMRIKRADAGEEENSRFVR